MYILGASGSEDRNWSASFSEDRSTPELARLSPNTDINHQNNEMPGENGNTLPKTHRIGIANQQPPLSAQSNTPSQLRLASLSSLEMSQLTQAGQAINQDPTYSFPSFPPVVTQPSCTLYHRQHQGESQNLSSLAPSGDQQYLNSATPISEIKRRVTCEQPCIGQLDDVDHLEQSNTYLQQTNQLQPGIDSSPTVLQSGNPLRHHIPSEIHPQHQPYVTQPLSAIPDPSILLGGRNIQNASIHQIPPEIQSHHQPYVTQPSSTINDLEHPHSNTYNGESMIYQDWSVPNDAPDGVAHYWIESEEQGSAIFIAHNTSHIGNEDYNEEITRRLQNVNPYMQTHL